jgi:hypothetical protein
MGAGRACAEGTQGLAAQGSHHATAKPTHTGRHRTLSGIKLHPASTAQSGRR